MITTLRTIFNLQTVNPIPRITEFEGLRAFLSWWVVWGHLLQYSGFVGELALPRLTSWLLKGDLAVHIFIILSGFVIFLLLDSNRTKTYFQFMCERFFRLYPIFIAMFVAAAIFMPLKAEVFSKGRWVDVEFAKFMVQHAEDSYNYFLPHTLMHLTLLHGLVPDQLLPMSSLAFLGPAWSISLEWQFYLIAPLLIIILRKSWIGFLVSLGIIKLVSKVASFFGLRFGYGAFLPLRIDLFVVGIFSYYIFKFAVSGSKTTTNRLLMVGFVVTLGIILCPFSPYSLASGKALPISLWLVVLGSAIATHQQIKFLPLNSVSYILNAKPAQILGRVSYSTYLIHTVVFWILMWITMKIYPDVNRTTMVIILGSFGCACVVGLSFLSYSWIEKPFVKTGKHISKQLNVKLSSRLP